jgi:hypothetical protein
MAMNFSPVRRSASRRAARVASSRGVSMRARESVVNLKNPHSTARDE